ncbi:asparagine synthase (glutamine-hydrolyzing) [Actinophytocola xanthii]|uniref:asparagine synthase (glutamine-hydrolyzing) n=1 Tax=Actinophytocola xanthii TaxID=1912961 RepID=A0A1Q8CU42_9PSEU|nr:asparagine synthase (glutamine-hydrolyzing) [Actinophytocola xanthii]OLF17870.1 asparagine synthase (glutamine-hydrolyzing) [Actinophytocola xanthii]
MCGITGWVSFGRDLRGETAVLDEMTDSMARRGPDERGTWVDRHAALGHRRLAVIDLPGGRQPMTVDTPRGAVTLVYSGEAYNFTELREELRGRGHRFHTRSDTEVVLHGYLEWGPAVAERLNGMFALAVWDARTRTLVMVRDRLGVKPLYYYPTPDGVLFGSEPKAILANPLADRVVGAEGLRELFAFVKTPGDAFWRGMHEVKPGTVVMVDPAGIRERTYWRLRTRPHTDDQDTTVARVRDLFEDIVRRQLVSDVPRCTLLSGGLDSSALTAVAAAQLGERGETVRSFSVDFEGRTEDFVEDAVRPQADTPFAHEVARHVGSEHQDIVLGAADHADPAVRAEVLRARDMPGGNGDLDTSLYLLFREIRKHSTVALSGESADEVFGGYLWYFDPAVRQAEMFPWLVRWGEYFGEDTEVLTHDARKVLDLDGYLRDSYATAVAEIERLDGESELEWRQRRISHLHLTRWVRVLLDRKDRTSMATGLEVRVPFCDHRLVEYVYNAPWALKTFDGREKSLLRAATGSMLPRSVLERAKAPYPSTQDPGYAAALRANAKDLLAAPEHPVFELVSYDWLEAKVREPDPQTTYAARSSLERALDIALWLDTYRPRVELT